MKKYIICAVSFILLFAAAVTGYNYLTVNYTPEGLPVDTVSDEATSVSEQTENPISSSLPEEQRTESEQLEISVKEEISENIETVSKETEPIVTKAVSEPTEASQTPFELKTEDFTVYDSDGQPVSLSDFFGKPIVVNFWSTWCEPCVDELPLFEELYTEYGNETAFFMINVPMDGASEKKVKAFIDESGYTFPVYYDSEYSASDAYGIWAVPQSLFINKEGELVQSYNGELSKDKLISYFELINSK